MLHQLSLRASPINVVDVLLDLPHALLRNDLFQIARNAMLYGSSLNCPSLSSSRDSVIGLHSLRFICVFSKYVFNVCSPLRLDINLSAAKNMKTCFLASSRNRLVLFCIVTLHLSLIFLSVLYRNTIRFPNFFICSVQ